MKSKRNETKTKNEERNETKPNETNKRKVIENLPRRMSLDFSIYRKLLTYYRFLCHMDPRQSYMRVMTNLTSMISLLSQIECPTDAPRASCHSSERLSVTPSSHLLLKECPLVCFWFPFMFRFVTTSFRFHSFCYWLSKLAANIRFTLTSLVIVYI